MKKKSDVSSSAKVLFVTDYLELGGATRVIQDLSEFVPSVLFANILDGRLVKKHFSRYPSDNLVLRNLRWNKSRLLFYTKIILSSFLLSMKYSFSKRSRDTVAHNSIIVFNLMYSAIGFLLNPFLYKTPKVMIFHGFWAKEEYYSERYLLGFIESKNLYRFKKIQALITYHIQFILQKLCLLSVSKVIVLSHYSEFLVRETFKIPQEKIYLLQPNFSRNVLINNSVIIDDLRKKLHITPSSIVFFIPSRFEFRKGIHLLLEAIYEINEADGNNSCAFVFSGPLGEERYSTECLSYAKTHNLTNVRFIDTVVRNKIGDYYRAVDCIIVPSLDLETFGLVTIEALYCSTPVLGFQSGATTELLSKIDRHLLISEISSSSLAKKIQWYISLNKIDKERLRKKCKNFVEKYYNQERITVEWSHFFTEEFANRKSS